MNYPIIFSIFTSVPYFLALLSPSSILFFLLFAKCITLNRASFCRISCNRGQKRGKMRLGSTDHYLAQTSGGGQSAVDRPLALCLPSHVRN